MFSHSSIPGGELKSYFSKSSLVPFPVVPQWEPKWYLSWNIWKKSSCIMTSAFLKKKKKASKSQEKHSWCESYVWVAKFPLSWESAQMCRTEIQSHTKTIPRGALEGNGPHPCQWPCLEKDCEFPFPYLLTLQWPIFLSSNSPLVKKEQYLTIIFCICWQII